MGKAKLGLALGGGSARGLSHIGVIKVLERDGFYADLIAGTSAGALIGALYAQGKSGAQIEAQAVEIGWAKLWRFVDPAPPGRGGFVKGQKVKDLLIDLLGGDPHFSDLKKPFACNATDINTGEEVVLDDGSVVEALRASISIPGIFSDVHLDGRYLVDGGVVNPVPVSVVKKLGADRVIAVNVIPDVKERNDHRHKGGILFKEPGVVGTLMRSIDIGTYALVRNAVRDADVLIEPKAAHIGSSEFDRSRELIDRGELAAWECIDEIRRKLGKLRVRKR